MPWTEYSPSKVDFVATPTSADLLPTGRQINWANVDAGLANADGNKVIPRGSAMVFDANGQMFRRLDAARVAETAEGLLRTDAVENDKVALLSGYGLLIGAAIWENITPDFADAAWATIKTELEAAGTGWSFYAHSDNTA